MLAGPASYLPYIAAALALLLLGVMLATFFLLRRSEGGGSATAGWLADWASERDREGGFRVAQRRLRAGRQRLAGLDAVADHPYAVPWVLVLGPPEARIAVFREALEPAEPGDPSANAIAGPHWTIRFCRDGALIETEERLLATEGWRLRLERLMRLLRADRPARPLDGLVIAIPAGWLTGPGALSHDRLIAEGTQLYEAVWALQRGTSLRVPIYLVVTGSEAFDGFTGLAAAVNEATRHEVLGWTTPYGLDAAFRPEWMNEALSAVVKGLGVIQLQAAALGATTEPAPLILLPQALGDAVEPLRHVVSAMLRPSVYHEPFLFRGLYFAGCDATGMPVFLQRLLSDLVFREYRLARAAPGVMARRARQIVLLQRAMIGIAVAGVAALAALSSFMPHRAERLEAALSKLAVLHTGQTAPVTADTVDRAKLFLQRLADIDFNHVGSLAAPTSYLALPDTRVSRAIAAGYDHLVLELVAQCLENKPRSMLGFVEVGSASAGANWLTSGPAAPPHLSNPPPPETWASRPSCATAVPPSPPVGAAAEDAPGLHAWRAAVGAVRKLDEEVQEYDRLTKTGSLENLGDLVDYTLGFRLPDNFLDHDYLYNEALRRAKPRGLNLEAMQNYLADRLTGLLHAAAIEYFSVEPLQQAAGVVDKQTRALETAAADTGAADTIAQLTALRDALKELAADAGAIARATDGSRLDQPIELLRGLTILPDAFIDQAAAQLASYKKTVTALAAALVNRDDLQVLQKTDRGFGLTTGYDELRAALDSLLGTQALAAHLASGTLDLPTSGVTWEIGVLNDAMKAVSTYQGLQAGGLPDLPPALRRGVKASLKQVLAAYVVDRVQAAARGAAASTSELTEDRSAARRAAIKNFNAAAPLLDEIRSGLQQAGLPQPAQRIALAEIGQAAGLLGEVDQALAAARLYTPLDPGFHLWRGTQPLAARSFGASSQAELVAFLAGQRSVVSDLAHSDAEPLVRFLTDAQPFDLRSRVDLTSRWAGIIEALQQYDQQAPGASLAQLEHFIGMELDQIDLGKCATGATTAPAAMDYFAERLAALKSALTRRCDALQHDRVSQSYGELATRFQATLAGRFPFASLAANGFTAEPAEPGDIRDFYRDFDAGVADPLAPRLRALANRTGVAAADFLDAIAASRAVLQPILGDAPPELPLAFQAEVEFRPLPNLESGGDQILEWVVEIGEQRLSSLDPKHPIDWSYGEPVRLSARWARQSPQVPAPGDAAAMPTVADDHLTAVWTLGDPWALLTLLRRQNAAVHAELPAAARQPETVLLTVPLQLNEDAATGGVLAPNNQARLFLRFHLSMLLRMPGQPDKMIPVTLPAFPDAAPALPGGVSASRS